jgi:hypothetical protein
MGEMMAEHPKPTRPRGNPGSVTVAYSTRVRSGITTPWDQDLATRHRPQTFAISPDESGLESVAELLRLIDRPRRRCLTRRGPVLAHWCSLGR